MGEKRLQEIKGRCEKATPAQRPEFGSGNSTEPITAARGEYIKANSNYGGKVSNHYGSISTCEYTQGYKTLEFIGKINIELEAEVERLSAIVENAETDETCEWSGDGGKFVQFYIYDARSCGEHNGATFKFCPYCGKRIITHPTAAPQFD